MNNFIPLISLGNEAPAPRAAAALESGIQGIAMANESRLTSGTFSEPLTAYVTGWREAEPLMETLNYIAPEVPVTRRFEFKKLLNSEAFLSDTDDERGIGSGFKRVEYSGETGLGKTVNRGLTYRMDMDDETLTEEQVVQLLTLRIYRNKLRRAITALLAIDNTGTNKTWDGSSNPISDMRAANAAAQLDSGVFPNRGIFGLVAYNLLQSAYESQQTAAAFNALNKTPQQLGQLVGLDDLRTSRELFQSSKTAKTRIMTSSYICFYAQDVISKDDPSHLKQFVSMGDQPGSGLRVHREEVGAKFVDITVEHYDSIVATATVGAKKLNIS